MAKTIAQLERTTEATFDRMADVIRDQAVQIEGLTARLAALEERPVASPPKKDAITQLASLPMLGAPSTRAACGVEEHGSVTLNKNGHCPKCACQAIKVAHLARYAARTPAQVA